MTEAKEVTEYMDEVLRLNDIADEMAEEIDAKDWEIRELRHEITEMKNRIESLQMQLHRPL